MKVVAPYPLTDLEKALIADHIDTHCKHGGECFGGYHCFLPKNRNQPGGELVGCVACGVKAEDPFIEPPKRDVKLV